MPLARLISAALAAAPLALALPTPAAAQIMSPTMLHGLSSADTKAIREASLAAVKSSAVGESQAWRGPEGRNGKATLVDGGDRAGKATARVRVTETKNKKDWALYTISFRRAADGSWAATTQQ